MILNKYNLIFWIVINISNKIILSQELFFPFLIYSKNSGTTNCYQIIKSVLQRSELMENYGAFQCEPYLCINDE